MSDADGEADDNTTRRRPRRMNSVEGGESTSQNNSTELNPNEQRHALPGNNERSDQDRNQGHRDEQKKIEPKKKRRDRPKNTPKSSTSTEKNNSTPQQGGSQSSQESASMPIVTQPEEGGSENFNTEMKKNEIEEEPSKNA